jgi:ubiquinone/menaquinone biosynthesis C-methylase UbiE
MPKQFGFKEQLMHKISELSPVDKALRVRAEWILNMTGVEKYLKKDGAYLDIGTGKGHVTQLILEDMEKLGKPLKMYAGIDVADKPLKKVQKRERARKDMGTAVRSDEKNPKNFVWASSDALPYREESFDGASFFFSIHHMNKESIDKAIEEAKRVVKKDGYIFITEDLVGDEEQRKITEKADKKLNWESEDDEHNYRSDEDWEKYFEEKGLEVVEKRFFESQSKKGPIRHGSYVLRVLV